MQTEARDAALKGNDEEKLKRGFQHFNNISVFSDEPKRNIS